VSFLRSSRCILKSEGIHIEPIQSARDKNFYSARIDQAYRAVIAKPNPGTYVLMWVDHHDDAYRWAERKRLDVNPATGAVQVLDLNMVEAAAQTKPVQAARSGPFAEIKDKHLIQLGVPQDLLPTVRGIESDGDLERAESSLPQEAYEALFLLASGYTVDQVFLEMQKPEQPTARNRHHRLQQCS
jgi:hypothetical protein